MTLFPPGNDGAKAGGASAVHPVSGVQGTGAQAPGASGADIADRRAPDTGKFFLL